MTLLDEVMLDDIGCRLVIRDATMKMNCGTRLKKKDWGILS